MKDFDQAAYWRDRVSGITGLGAVGHRALGVTYNQWIYQRRIDVLTKLCEQGLSIVPHTRLLDLGCGTGFYVPFWQARGVRELVGVDVSAQNVAALRQLFPQCRFVEADLTRSDPLRLGEFDIITLFDVLYHVVDDNAAAAALAFASRHLSAHGRLLIFDQLLDRNYSLRKHVKFRGRVEFGDMLGAHGLQIETELPLFFVLEPPIFGNRLVDTLVAGAYFGAGLLFRAMPSLGGMVGKCAYYVDNALDNIGARIPNHKLYIARRAG